MLLKKFLTCSTKKSSTVSYDIKERYKPSWSLSLEAVGRGRVALVLIHNSTPLVPLEPRRGGRRTRGNKGASGKGKRQSDPLKHWRGMSNYRIN